jgi:hypothetical protein
VNSEAKKASHGDGNGFRSREASRTVVKREHGAVDALAGPMRRALSDEKGKSSNATDRLEGQNAINQYISYWRHKGHLRRRNHVMSADITNLGLAQKCMRQRKDTNRIARGRIRCVFLKKETMLTMTRTCR